MEILPTNPDSEEAKTFLGLADKVLSSLN